mmetsp:Transcript_6121/g.17698  ORF Transcript_6121/g.17698 Transcript_6121/m.17698 type:complete len:325 (+) Transcript_6121:189-1163(+)
MQTSQTGADTVCPKRGRLPLWATRRIPPSHAHSTGDAVPQALSGIDPRMCRARRRRRRNRGRRGVGMPLLLAGAPQACDRRLDLPLDLGDGGLALLILGERFVVGILRGQKLRSQLGIVALQLLDLHIGRVGLGRLDLLQLGLRLLQVVVRLLLLRRYRGLVAECLFLELFQQRRLLHDRLLALGNGLLQLLNLLLPLDDGLAKLRANRRISTSTGTSTGTNARALSEAVQALQLLLGEVALGTRILRRLAGGFGRSSCVGSLFLLRIHVALLACLSFVVVVRILLRLPGHGPEAVIPRLRIPFSVVGVLVFDIVLVVNVVGLE